MFIKKAILNAYIKEYGNKSVCREQFIQAHPEGFEAILACFGTYAEFQTEVTATTPAPVAKVVKPVAK